MRYYLIRFTSETNNYFGEEDLRTFNSELEALRFAIDRMAEPTGKVEDIISLNYRYQPPEITRYELAIKNGGFALQIIPEEKTPQK